MIRHKGLQSLSSTSVACLRIEGAPKHHIGSLLQTPPSVLVLSSHALCAPGRVLFCSFSDSALSKTMELNPISSAFGCEFFALFLAVRLSLLQLFACRLRFFSTLWLFGCELFCSLHHHLSSSWRATLWISLGRGLGDFGVAHPFHPWTYVSNQITHLFSDGIVSQEMPDVGVKLSARHPPVHSNGFSAHLLSIVKVFAFYRSWVFLKSRRGEELYPRIFAPP